jgi:hypothetical protein
MTRWQAERCELGQLAVRGRELATKSRLNPQTRMSALPQMQPIPLTWQQPQTQRSESWETGRFYRLFFRPGKLGGFQTASSS